jgi:hypothetical protein
MMLPGETVNDTTVDCECGELLNIQVLRSNTGYYIGFECPKCGPYSRESGYYNDFEDAQEDLDDGVFNR